MDSLDRIGARFKAAFDGFDPAKPVLILTHNDADGLSSGALFKRVLDNIRRTNSVRILGRGENPWSDAMRAELARQDIGGLIVADLGVRGGPLKPGVFTIVVDHHVPTGEPDATVLTGYGLDPVPTTSLLAYACGRALSDVDDLIWLAAVGLVGDLGDKAPFAELDQARTRYTGAAIRELVSLVNAPRRASAGNPQPAFDLLMRAESPKDALKGPHPEADTLRAARDEVKAAVEAGKHVPPRVKGDVALITLDSPCQIHPLVAQAWRTRLKDKIVIAANLGFRPGWVHFAARSATGRNLISYLREVAPPTADENYGSGHEQATGGALRQDDWPVFLRNIGHAA